ncbi:aconitase X swivel domain-containing protein [Candidatus Poribacteria bacterium]
MELIGRSLVSGSAKGVALVSKEPISFWGGIDTRTGEIIDRRHELSGANVAGKIFVFPQGRGSSTSSAVMLEIIRAGVAPAAIINLRVEPILALGAIIADELYHRTVPIVVLPEAAFHSIKKGGYLTIASDGTVNITDVSPS